MSLENFRSLKDKRDELVLVSTNMAVIGAPYGTALPEKVVDTDGSLLPLPEGWFSFGEVSKEAGAELTPDRNYNDILGYGSMAARRRIKDSEGMTLNVTPQETRAVLMAMQYSKDISELVNGEGDSGFTASKYSTDREEYWSILLIGFDGTEQEPIYPWWLFPKMAIGDGSSTSLSTDSPLAGELQFVAYEEGDGKLYDFGIGGKGWVQLAEAAGFEGDPTEPESP